MKKCDFFTDNRQPNAHPINQRSAPQKLKRSFDNLEDALNACGSSQFDTPFPDKIYRYFSADGICVGAVGRWNRGPKGKEIRPVALRDGRWIIGGMDSPRPLYNLPAILDAVRLGRMVYLVEGEKAADALIEIGIVATTSAHGADAYKSTDWGPLRGASVRVWPDRDEQGEKYARNVQEQIGATAHIVRPFTLGQKEDAFDWIELQKKNNPEYATPEALREEIDRECESYLKRCPDDSETATPSASVAESSANVTVDEVDEDVETPFPIECLGECLRDFVEAHANSIGVPYSYVALPVITILGSLLCGKRSLAITDSWNAHPVFWMAIIAPSGSKKSAGYRPAMEEIDRLNAIEQKKYDRNCERYFKKLKEYEKAGETSKKPRMPRLRRVCITDATFEGTTRQMNEQKSPLLVVSDELTLWINSFTRYNNNSAINGWLSLHNLASHTVSRADPSKNFIIPRAAANVFGTVQTDRFGEAMASGNFVSSGFLARCLFTFAKSKRQPFSKKSPRPIEGPTENYNRIVSNLHKLPHPESSDKPPRLEMALEADKVWKVWYDETMVDLRKESARWPDPSPQLSAWNSGVEKIEELPARLAVVLHVVECIGTEDLNTPVSGETMANAIEIAKWFTQGLRRVCREIADQPAKNGPTYRQLDSGEYVLAKFDRDSGERLSIREVLRRCRRYKTVDELQLIVDSLVKNGSLIIETEKTESGSSARFYRLA